MKAAYTFRDATLKSVPLRALNRVGGVLERFGRAYPVLDADQVVSASQKAAGTSDLGSDSYREPLERYIEAVREEAELNSFGRLAVRGMLVLALTNRIKLNRWAQEHPEIRDERIERPWVIVVHSESRSRFRRHSRSSLAVFARPSVAWRSRARARAARFLRIRCRHR